MVNIKIDEDIELREFSEHPGWKQVFVSLDKLLYDLMSKAARANQSDHDLFKGRLEGAERTIGIIRNVLNQWREPLDQKLKE